MIGIKLIATACSLAVARTKLGCSCLCLAIMRLLSRHRVTLWVTQGEATLWSSRAPPLDDYLWSSRAPPSGTHDTKYIKHTKYTKHIKGHTTLRADAQYANLVRRFYAFAFGDSAKGMPRL
ncbi:MAG: hypothetical protein MJE68_00725, partial [Proteobacteria bacterium]|nr:hypothetical protein [Pseudomonadota bacterium]